MRDLEIARIPRDDISMVARNLDNRVADPDASNAGAGAAAGASIGGVLGGVIYRWLSEEPTGTVQGRNP